MYYVINTPCSIFLPDKYSSTLIQDKIFLFKAKTVSSPLYKIVHIHAKLDVAGGGGTGGAVALPSYIK